MNRDPICIFFFIRSRGYAAGACSILFLYSIPTPLTPHYDLYSPAVSSLGYYYYDDSTSVIHHSTHSGLDTNEMGFVGTTAVHKVPADAHTDRPCGHSHCSDAFSPSCGRCHTRARPNTYILIIDHDGDGDRVQH